LGVIIFALSIGCNKETDLNGTSQNETRVIHSNIAGTVMFTDASYFVVDSILDSLGFTSLQIAEGTYTINYDPPSDYGTVSLNIESFTIPAGTTPTSDVFKIYIGNRKKGCIYGIGFRCGIGGIDEPFEDDRFYSANLTPNISSGTIDITFNESVDWESYMDEEEDEEWEEQ